MLYFVITSDEDGGHVRQMSKDELEKALNQDEMGRVELGFSTDALTSISEPEINYWGHNFLIIRGEIVVPKTEKVVTRTII